MYKRQADAGAADTIRLDGQQLFRLCGDDGHHHHLVCRRCGKTVEIDPPSEAWLRKVADGHGFTVESHTLEVFGPVSYTHLNVVGALYAGGMSGGMPGGMVSGAGGAPATVPVAEHLSGPYSGRR